MVKKVVTEETSAIEIIELSKSCATFHVRGTSPLIYNRMSEKAKRELLLPKGRRSSAERAATPKHNPIEEFNASVYSNPDAKAPTLLQLPAPMFKGAMSTTALDMPGTKKSEIGRLCWVGGYSVDVYGIPKLLVSTVRSADINRTPDIRTRAIVENWCTKIDVWFVPPKLTEVAVARLLAAAGLICGVGDFRQEKGKGSFGQFTIVPATDEKFVNLMKTAGRQAQIKAMHEAEPYDQESEEMLNWYNNEVIARFGRKAA